MSYNIYKKPKTREDAYKLMLSLQARERNSDMRELKKKLRLTAKGLNK